MPGPADHIVCQEPFIKTLKPLRYLAAPTLALTLWLLSSRSTLPMPSGILGLDKLAHFAAYATLAVTLVLWPKAETWRLRPLRTALIIIAIASVYGGIDELHQSYVPGRDASVFDWLADTLGAGFGAAGSAWRQARQARKARTQTST